MGTRSVFPFLSLFRIVYAPIIALNRYLDFTHPRITFTYIRAEIRARVYKMGHGGGQTRAQLSCNGPVITAKWEKILE